MTVENAEVTQLSVAHLLVVNVPGALVAYSNLTYAEWPMRRLGLSMPENELIFPADVHVKGHRKIADRFRHLIEFRGYEDVVLDFSQAATCFQEAIVPIVALARKYQSEGARFALILPKDERLRRLFLNCNWAALMSPKQFKKSLERQDLNLPAREYRNEEEQSLFVKDVLDRILRVTRHLDRSHIRALEWSLNEVSDNVLLHSQSELGGIGQLSIRPHGREVEFVIADAGIGIPASLRTAKREEWDDYETLQQAIREGVTRGIGQGNGLFGSFRVSTLSGGAFSINSGFAFLYGSRDGTVHGQLDDLEFPGTSVTCAISYARPLVLEEALKFKGTSHTPVDFIELGYEGFDENSTIIEVSKETISVGSRRLGYELRTKIENIARMGDDDVKVIIDLKGLPVMASSFADEAIAKLVVSTGFETFARRFRLANVDAINRQIIDRSVSQRLESSSALDVLYFG